MMKKKGFQVNRVLDGGLGREIKKRGLPFRFPEWSTLVLMEQPDAVVDIHNDFISQGAQIITTNTYSIVPSHIGEEEFKKRGQEYIKLACEKAKEAKQSNNGKNIQIAFSIPPMYGSYQPQKFFQNKNIAESLYNFFIDPVLELDYIDFFLCETISSVDEALLLMNILQNVQKPFCFSFTQLNWKGDKVETFAQKLSQFDHKPEAIMVNCSHIQTILDIVRRLREAFPPNIKIGCYPNNFQQKVMDNYDPQKQNFVVYESLKIEEFQKYAESWIRSGAQIVGGCCGIGPEYIPAIHSAFKNVENERKQKQEE